MKKTLRTVSRTSRSPARPSTCRRYRRRYRCGPCRPARSPVSCRPATCKSRRLDRCRRTCPACIARYPPSSACRNRRDRNAPNAPASLEHLCEGQIVQRRPRLEAALVFQVCIIEHLRSSSHARAPALSSLVDGQDERMLHCNLVILSFHDTHRSGDDQLAAPKVLDPALGARDSEQSGVAGRGSRACAPGDGLPSPAGPSARCQEGAHAL